MSDLKFGLRQLLKQPGYAAIAILTLALGIGASTAIFSVVHAVLLRPLPFAQPADLIALNLVHEQSGPEGSPLSLADYVDTEKQNRLFKLAAFNTAVFNYTGGDTPEQLEGAWVTSGFFSTLGTTPLLGRGFRTGEDKPGGEPVVLLSEPFWRSRFNADRDVVGRSITLSGRPFTVVGVMPGSFQFPAREVQLWTVLPLEPPTRRGPYYLTGLARKPAGMTLAHARTELARIANEIKLSVPDVPSSYGYVSRPLEDWLVGRVRPALLVLLGAVGFVLLIASLNVANLLLSRAAAREKEITIRAALGASRARIVRQFLTENLVLAAFGGVMGLLFSVWGIDLLRSFGPENVPRLAEASIDRWVLGCTLLLSLGSGLFFGVFPAWHASRTNLNASLKEGGRAAAGGLGARRLRQALVVTEIALALVLLIGAGLLLRSFVRLQQVDAGFQPQHVLSLRIPLPRAKYPEDPQITSFYDRLLTAVSSLPGVRSVALGSSLPPNRLEVSDNFWAEGQPPLPDEKSPLASALFTSPGYFRTLGIPLLQGREFNERDRAESSPVVIINETLARKFYPGQNPVGKHFKLGGVDRPGNPWMEVVGVVGDVKYEGLHKETSPAFYQPLRQLPLRTAYLLVKTSIPPAAAANAVRAEVWKIDREIPVSEVNTLEGLIDESLAQPKFRTFLVGVFSSIALLLAAVGIYGVIAYSVAQRTREIGIRMALGAKRSDVLRLILGNGLSLALIGIALGLIGAFLLTRLTAKLLFGVGATDPVTFTLLSLLLLAVALIASYLPARRAASVQPNVALRTD